MTSTDLGARLNNLYVNHLEDFPIEVGKLISQFREVDEKIVSIIREVEDLSFQCQSNECVINIMKILLEKLEECQNDKQIFADEINHRLVRFNSSLVEAKDACEDSLLMEQKPDCTIVARKAPLKRGRKPKKRVDEEVKPEEGLLLLAETALKVKIEEQKVKKIPVTKRKSRKGKRRKSKAVEVNEEGVEKEQEANYTDEAPPTGDEDEDLFCICNKPSFGNMVSCDNESCSIEWFHFNCVNLKRAPKGKWYCPKCRSKKSNIIKKELSATNIQFNKYLKRACRNQMSLG